MGEVVDERLAHQDETAVPNGHQDAAFVGFAYRRREKAALWIILTLVFGAIALVMVYVKPF